MPIEETVSAVFDRQEPVYFLKDRFLGLSKEADRAFNNFPDHFRIGDFRLFGNNLYTEMPNNGGYLNPNKLGFLLLECIIADDVAQFQNPDNHQVSVQLGPYYGPLSDCLESIPLPILINKHLIGLTDLYIYNTSGPINGVGIRSDGPTLGAPTAFQGEQSLTERITSSIPADPPTTNVDTPNYTVTTYGVPDLIKSLEGNASDYYLAFKCIFSITPKANQAVDSGLSPYQQQPPDPRNDDPELVLPPAVAEAIRQAQWVIWTAPYARLKVIYGLIRIGS